MVNIGNYPTAVQPGERPFVSRDHPRGRILTVAHQQSGVGLVEIAAGIGAVSAVGKKLHLARGVWLETHQQPA